MKKYIQQDGVIYQPIGSLAEKIHKDIYPLITKTAKCDLHFDLLAMRWFFTIGENELACCLYDVIMHKLWDSRYHKGSSVGLIGYVKNMDELVALEMHVRIDKLIEHMLREEDWPTKPHPPQ